MLRQLISSLETRVVLSLVDAEQSNTCCSIFIPCFIFALTCFSAALPMDKQRCGQAQGRGVTPRSGSCCCNGAASQQPVTVQHANPVSLHDNFAC